MASPDIGSLVRSKLRDFQMAVVNNANNYQPRPQTQGLISKVVNEISLSPQQRMARLTPQQRTNIASFQANPERPKFGVFGGLQEAARLPGAFGEALGMISTPLSAPLVSLSGRSEVNLPVLGRLPSISALQNDNRQLTGTAGLSGAGQDYGAAALTALGLIPGGPKLGKLAKGLPQVSRSTPPLSPTGGDILSQARNAATQLMSAGEGSGSKSGPKTLSGIKAPPSGFVAGAKNLANQGFNRARNVIAQQGVAGQELAQGLQTARDVAETTAGNWVSRLPTVRSLSKRDFENFVDVAEGTAKPLNPVVARAAQEWDSIRKQVYGLAKTTGLDIGQVTNYFPHRYDESMFKGDNYVKAVNHLVQTGQAADANQAAQLLRHAQDVIRNRRQGNLELERLVNLPGYQKTKEALFGYLESAANRIAQVNHFGPDDSKAMELINRIAQEGGDASTAKSLFDISVGAAKQGELQQKISTALRGYNTVTKLGLGAITNVGQNVNTATVTGLMKTLQAGKAAFTPEAQDFALKAGVTLDGVINDLREGAGFSGKVLGKISAPGFGKVERFNRTVAAWAGKGYAEDLAQQAAQGSSKAINALAKLGLDPQAVIARGGQLDEQELVTAARRIVERTQFKVDPQDLPGWASSPWGKVLTQFKSFSYNQTAFLTREVIQPALKGDVAPLVRFLTLAVPTGAAIKETKNILQNRDSEENPVKRVQQYYSQAGGLGLAGDVVTGLFPQNGKYLPQDRAVSLALGTIGGPTVGNVAEGYGSLTQAVQGKPTSLARFGLRQTPIVGTTAVNTLLPYNTGSSGPGQTQPLANAAQAAGPADQLQSEIQAALADGVITPVEEARLKGLKSDLDEQEKKVLADSGVTLPLVGRLGGLSDEEKNTKVTQLRAQQSKLDKAIKNEPDYSKLGLTGNETVDATIRSKQNADLDKQIEDIRDRYARGSISLESAASQIKAIELKKPEAPSVTFATKNAEFSLNQEKLQRENDFAGYMKSLTEQISYLQDYRKTIDPDTDKKKALELDNKIADLQAKIGKFTGYGGFKKPKKPKKLSVGGAGSVRKISLKSRRVKASKLKKLPAIKFKAVANPKRPRVQRLKAA